MIDPQTCHDLPAEEAPGETVVHKRYHHGSVLSIAIESWQTKREEDVHRKVAAASAAVSREIYRREREAEGKTVRPYTFHQHDPWKHGETHESRERRLHRDRTRAARGVDDTTVRPWTDHSEMSEEEETLHNRQLANERKARERRLKRLPPAANVASVADDQDMEWGMF